jgi:hypothetical protein
MNLLARLLLDINTDLRLPLAPLVDSIRLPRKQSGIEASMEGVALGSRAIDLVRVLDVKLNQ